MTPKKRQAVFLAGLALLVMMYVFFKTKSLSQPQVTVVEKEVEPKERRGELEEVKRALDSVWEIRPQDGYQPGTWKRINLPDELRGVEINITGEVDPLFPTKDQRRIIGPSGVDLSSIPYYNRADSGLSRSELVAPHLPYLSALARICNADECTDAQVFKGNPWKFCIPEGKWLEFRVNYLATGVQTGMYPNGEYKIRVKKGSC